MQPDSISFIDIGRMHIFDVFKTRRRQDKNLLCFRYTDKRKPLKNQALQSYWSPSPSNQTNKQKWATFRLARSPFSKQSITQCNPVLGVWESQHENASHHNRTLTNKQAKMTISNMIILPFILLFLSLSHHAFRSRFECRAPQHTVRSIIVVTQHSPATRQIWKKSYRKQWQNND